MALIDLFLMCLLASLLDDPVSDLGNPDCLDSQVSWNKNPKNDNPFCSKGLCLFVRSE